MVDEMWAVSTGKRVSCAAVGGGRRRVGTGFRRTGEVIEGPVESNGAFQAWREFVLLEFNNDDMFER